MKKLSTAIMLFVFLFVVTASVISANQLKLQQNQQQEKPSNHTLIEIWQLDMIEGGIGSRQKLLSKVAKLFEKKNDGVIVSVVNETLSSAEEKLKNGIYPDIISYSNGLEGFLESSIPLKYSDNFGGSLADKTYGVAWAYGGYALITKKGASFNNIKTCYVSQNDYTLPLVAYYLSSNRFENLEIKKPSEAYAAFVADKNAVLLGTQRDLFRLEKREIEFDCVALNEFSDLIQYVSIIGEKGDSRVYEKAFVEFLINEGQAYINEIGMKAVNHNNDKKQIETLNCFENLNKFKCFSIFNSRNKILELQNILADKSINEKEKLTTIENVVRLY